ncbi:MAG: hypothetical protein MUE85_01805 [Microscillaceae bacterium]|jgi:hypothetical protein|nr:hypothetical protein [Microscillaceae bacterium]
MSYKIKLVLHPFSGMRIFFILLSINEPSDSLVKLPSEAPKNLKLLIINALDSSHAFGGSESLKSESFSEFNGIAEGNS